MTCCVMGQYGPLVGFAWIYFHLFEICTAQTSHMDLKDAWSVFCSCFCVVLLSIYVFLSTMFSFVPGISLQTKSIMMIGIFIWFVVVAVVLVAAATSCLWLVDSTWIRCNTLAGGIGLTSPHAEEVNDPKRLGNAKPRDLSSRKRYV